MLTKVCTDTVLTRDCLTKSGYVCIVVWARFNKAYERRQNTGLYTQSAAVISAGNRTFALPYKGYTNLRCNWDE